MLGLGNLLNEGIRSYIQVSYDFIQDSIRKLVLMEPPSPFPLFLIPYLMDTPRVWYRWKGILRTISALGLRGAQIIFHEQCQYLSDHGHQHILSIYIHFFQDHP